MVKKWLGNIGVEIRIHKPVERGCLDLCFGVWMRADRRKVWEGLEEMGKDSADTRKSLSRAANVFRGHKGLRVGGRQQIAALLALVQPSVVCAESGENTALYSCISSALLLLRVYGRGVGWDEYERRRRRLGQDLVVAPLRLEF